MTNEQIIENAKQELLQQGLLKPTGRILTARLEDGSEILIPEAGLAPAQEGEDHCDRLAAADGAVGEHHAVMLLSGSGMPPV